VVQYGVGPIGASIAQLMRQKCAIEICGAIDSDPAKVGRDLGDVVGAGDAPWGIPISDDEPRVLQQAPHVVIHSTSSSLPRVMDQLLACVRAGSCVVSTCEELAYPFRTNPALAEKLDAEAKAHGVAVVGTGVNPGFVMDKLAVTLAAESQRVEQVRISRVVNASNRRLPLQRKIGAGMTPDDFAASAANGTIRHVGLPESVAMIAHYLNLPVEEISEMIEPVIARERVSSDFLTVETGQVAGVHQIARGLSGGRDLVYLELQMYVGAKNPYDRIELQGHPAVSLMIPSGSHGDIATASVVVNSVPAILQAQPGLRTSCDLPIGFLSPTLETLPRWRTR